MRASTLESQFRQAGQVKQSAREQVPSSSSKLLAVGVAAFQLVITHTIIDIVLGEVVSASAILMRPFVCLPHATWSLSGIRRRLPCITAGQLKAQPGAVKTSR